MLRRSVFAGIAILSVASAVLIAQKKDEGRNAPNTGYSDTPVIPKQTWKVHDIARPAPPMVTPGAKPGDPPSDAIVLFDGKDLSKWQGSSKGKLGDPKWTVKDGYMYAEKGSGDLVSKESFGDAQYHVEWASPVVIDGASQWRGNSGFIIQKRYEIQVLDSWNNPTYADGQAASIYGQWPPMVNVSRKPGEWQYYDIAWEAPRFEGGKMVKPPYVTVFHNGVLVHHHQELIGQMAHRAVRPFEEHPYEQPLALQDHDTRTRFRNIWVRKLKGYDTK